MMEQETFTNITDEQASKWGYALHKRAEEKKSMSWMYDFQIQQLEKDIEAVKARKAEALKDIEDEIQYLTNQLKAYHMEQLQADKKRKTIKMPWFDLKSKAKSGSFEHDDKALLEWARTSNEMKFIKQVVTEKLDWTNLKENIQVINGMPTYEGEVLEGVKFVPEHVEFSVDLLEE